MAGRPLARHKTGLCRVEADGRGWVYVGRTSWFMVKVVLT